MGVVAPAVSVFSTPAAAPATAPAFATQVATPAPAPKSSIEGTAHKGVLDVSLIVSPPAVGRARLFVTVLERGKAVTDGQIRIKLSVPGEAALGAVFSETTQSSGGYSGSGDLVQAGRWQADVLVRTHSDPLEFRDVPLQFIAGTGAGFLPAGFDPAAIQAVMSPGLIGVPNTLVLSGLPVTGVQLQSASLDMDMGAETVSTSPLGGGRWKATELYAPMEGRWGLTVQIELGGAWTTVRQLVFEVPVSGKIRLQSGAQATPGATAAG
jgi:hypothetical protein